MCIIRAFMWKRWLPILLVTEVCCLVVAAGWAVHRHAAETVSVPRITPAEWPYKEAGSAPSSTRVVAPPVPFRTDHPPADAFRLRPIGPEEVTDHSREKLEVRTPRTREQSLPPGTRPLDPSAATVYYEPLGH